MNNGYFIKQASGQITSGIAENTHVMRTIEFIHQQLTAWRDDKSRPVESAEEKLNLQLSKFLNVRARNFFPMVCFNHEEFQTGQRRADISVLPSTDFFINARLHSIYDAFLVIECKRLPAPSIDREQEYVTGGGEKSTGGIQRFKLGLHGKDLQYSVIIGYIQAGNSSAWHNQINRWILDLSDGKKKDNCIWHYNETLGQLTEDQLYGVSNCKSVHSRESLPSNNSIEIYHLWINMVVNHTSLRLNKSAL